MRAHRFVVETDDSANLRAAVDAWCRSVGVKRSHYVAFLLPEKAAA